ncbi:hypothetical protein CHUAL_004395 [Chamberlinius hualienensis]
MSSNRVRYTDDVALSKIITAIVDKFQNFLANSGTDGKKQQLCVTEFKKVLENSIKANVYCDKNDGQHKDEVIGGTSDYDLMNELKSMVLEVAEKRKQYPSEIGQRLKEKYELEEKIIQLKRNGRSDVEPIQPAIQSLRTDFQESITNSVSQIILFHKVCDDFKEQVEAYKHVTQQLQLISEGY